MAARRPPTADSQPPPPLTLEERAELLKELRRPGSGVPERYSGIPPSAPAEQLIRESPAATLHDKETEHVNSLNSAEELKKLLGVDASRLQLGVCCSGGGMRAFYESAGFIAGLEDTGILPSVKYIATLSGSAWMQWAFLASQKFKKYGEFATHAGSKPLRAQWGLEWSRMMSDVWQKQAGLIDFVAAVLQALIVEQLVGRTESLVYISRTLPVAQKPFPVSTFIKLEEQDPIASHWFEVSPYEVAHSRFRETSVTAIPTKYFGCLWDTVGSPRHMSGALSQAEDDLAFLMAICGSAYGAQVADLVRNVPPSAGKALKLWAWCNGYNDHDTVVNPVLGDFTKHRLPSSFCMVRDAGIALNLPFLPLLRRSCNVIIVKDASFEYATPTKTHPCTGEEMRRAALWAQRWGFTDFPTPEDVDAVLPKGQLAHEVYHITGKNRKIHILYVPRFTDIGTFEMCWAKEASEAAVREQREFVARQHSKIVAILKSIAVEVVA